jgi:hypothetical protein
MEVSIGIDCAGGYVDTPAGEHQREMSWQSGELPPAVSGAFQRRLGRVRLAWCEKGMWYQAGSTVEEAISNFKNQLRSPLQSLPSWRAWEPSASPIEAARAQSNNARSNNPPSNNALPWSGDQDELAAQRARGQQ